MSPQACDASVGRVLRWAKTTSMTAELCVKLHQKHTVKQAATGLTAEELKDAYIKPLKEGRKEAVVPTVTKDGFESSTQVEGVYGEIFYEGDAC